MGQLLRRSCDSAGGILWLALISQLQLPLNRIQMIRSILFRSTIKNKLPDDEQVLYPNISKQATTDESPVETACDYYRYDRQNSRQTHLSKEMNESIDFITIEPELQEIKYRLDQLQPYEADKIKFMTKVQVFDQKCQGIKTKIKITKEPIYANEDVIVFLLTLQWYPNSVKAANKPRKGSFATEKELKVRFQKTAIQQEEFLTIAYVLSEKIYIHERHIDAFIKALNSKSAADHKQQNCLTAILANASQKRHLHNLASTMDETKNQNYWFDSSSYANTIEDRYDRMALLGTKQQEFLNKFLPLPRRSSRFLQKSARSPRMSMGSREYLSEETCRKGSVHFNTNQAKRWFSSVEYILSDGEIGTETIIYHLSDCQNISLSGLRLEALEAWLQQWPRSNSFSRLYKINKQKILSRLLQQVKSNYHLMVQMEFQEVNEKDINQIYLLIKEFRQKTMEEYIAAAKEYVNEPDYNQYHVRLENQLSMLETELFNNYGISKKQYGSRILKHFERKNYESGNYTLMKVIGRQKINKLDIGFRRYKEILFEDYLQQCFEDFKHKKNRQKGRFLSKYAQNHEEEQLNYVENRIQICEGKKTMLERAIELEIREKQNLKMMLQILQKEEGQEVLASERITN